MQRAFDCVMQDSEREIRQPCSRRDCGARGTWEIRINSRTGTYYLCDPHFIEYEEVRKSRLYYVEDEMVAYMRKIGAMPR